MQDIMLPMVGGKGSVTNAFGSGLWIYRRGALSGRGGAYHAMKPLSLMIPEHS